MTKVVFDISLSLDGFMTATDQRPDEPLGPGGQVLHAWAFAGDEQDQKIILEGVAAAGAVVAGCRTYDTSVPWWGADGPNGDARLRFSSSRTASPRRCPTTASTASSTGSSPRSRRRRAPPETRA